MSVSEQASLRRQDELMALEAILSPEEFALQRRESSEDEASSSQLKLEVAAALSSSKITLRIRTHTFSYGAHGSMSTEDPDQYTHRIEESVLLDVQNLPPIQLLLSLSDDYPLDSPPRILHINLDYIGHVSLEVDQPQGIPPPLMKHVAEVAAASRADFTRRVLSRLMQEWDSQKGEVLYSWYEMLRESIWTGGGDGMLDEGGTALTLDEYVIADEGRSSAPTANRLQSILRTFDLMCRRKNFEGKRFGCGICLEEKRGGKCFRISSCGHVFCQECLTNYLSSMIREGYVRQAAACPDPDCVKVRIAAENCAQGASTTGVREKNAELAGAIKTEELVKIVGRDLVARLGELKEKAVASADPSAGFCPRPACQRLVRSDPKDVGTAYEAMRQCSCGYTYCLYCNKSWHGSSPCNIVSSTALIDAYRRSAAGSAERRGLELRYGRNNLERMIRTYEEEESNRKWMEENTQSCPCCRIHVQKSVGCNHMSCKSCNTHFCYRCGTRLPPQEPYKHFNTPGTPCYMKLFDAEMMAGDAGWDVAQDGEMAQWEVENL